MLYVLIISRAHFRVNPHPIFAWMSRNSLLETGTISEVWPNGWVFVYKLSGIGLSPVAVTKTSDIAPVSSKEFLDIKANIECRFTLKCVRDMIRIYSQIHRTDKYSQHSSIIWPVWRNGWVCLRTMWFWVRVPLQSLKINNILYSKKKSCANFSLNFNSNASCYFEVLTSYSQNYLTIGLQLAYNV